MAAFNDKFNFPSGLHLPRILWPKVEAERAKGDVEEAGKLKFLTAEKVPVVSAEVAEELDLPNRSFSSAELELRIARTSIALAEIQKQIHRGEEIYYEETIGHGNIFKGWDGLLDAKDVGTSSNSKPPRDTRWFSGSSSVRKIAASWPERPATATAMPPAKVTAIAIPPARVIAAIPPAPTPKPSIPPPPKTVVPSISVAAAKPPPEPSRSVVPPLSVATHPVPPPVVQQRPPPEAHPPPDPNGSFRIPKKKRASGFSSVHHTTTTTTTTTTAPSLTTTTAPSFKAAPETVRPPTPVESRAEPAMTTTMTKKTKGRKRKGFFPSE